MYPVVQRAEFPQLPRNYLANSKISLNEDWGMYEVIQPSWTKHHRTDTILTKKKKKAHFLTKSACSDWWLIDSFLPEKMGDRNTASGHNAANSSGCKFTELINSDNHFG